MIWNNDYHLLFVLAFCLIIFIAKLPSFFKIKKFVGTTITIVKSLQDQIHDNAFDNLMDRVNRNVNEWEKIHEIYNVVNDEFLKKCSLNQMTQIVEAIKNCPKDPDTVFIKMSLLTKILSASIKINKP